MLPPNMCACVVVVVCVHLLPVCVHVSVVVTGYRVHARHSKRKRERTRQAGIYCWLLGSPDPHSVPDLFTMLVPYSADNKTQRDLTESASPKLQAHRDSVLLNALDTLSYSYPDNEKLLDKTCFSMFNFSSHLNWFQNKIGCYDQQNWEASVEQRILHGLENRPKREGSLNKELIDIDLVRGSTFSKAKPRHGLKHVVINGLKRVVFFPYYFRHWQDHFTKEVIVLCLLHYFIQLLQLICYFFWSQSTEIMVEEILLPLVLALVLGVLHAHIIAPCTIKQRRKKTGSSITTSSNAVVATPVSVASSQQQQQPQSTMSPPSPTAVTAATEAAVTVETLIGRMETEDTPQGVASEKDPDMELRQRHMQPSPLFQGQEEEEDEEDEEEVHHSGDEETEAKDDSSSSSLERGSRKTAVVEESVPEPTVALEPAKRVADQAASSSAATSSPQLGGGQNNSRKNSNIMLHPHPHHHHHHHQTRQKQQHTLVGMSDNTGIVTDEEALQKFIASKNKQIPDPTPVNVIKKDKNAKQTVPTLPKIHKTPKSRRVVSESTCLAETISDTTRTQQQRAPEPGGRQRQRNRVSSSSRHGAASVVLAMGNAGQQHQQQQQLTTENMEEKYNDVMTGPSRVCQDAAVESWINSSSSVLPTVNSGNGQCTREHVTHSSTSTSTALNGECGGHNEPLELRTASNNDEDPEPPISNGPLRRKIEVRKVSSADASPTLQRSEKPSAGSGSTEKVTGGKQQRHQQLQQEQRNVELNEDTITKSHRKRDEYKALFESRALAAGSAAADENDEDDEEEHSSRGQLNCPSQSSSSCSSSSVSPSRPPKSAGQQPGNTSELQGSGAGATPGVAATGPGIKRPRPQRTNKQSVSKKPKDVANSLSETEYDRMNSDVNSSGVSTSDEGEEVLIPRPGEAAEPLQLKQREQQRLTKQHQSKSGESAARKTNRNESNCTVGDRAGSASSGGGVGAAVRGGVSAASGGTVSSGHVGDSPDLQQQMVSKKNGDKDGDKTAAGSGGVKIGGSSPHEELKEDPFVLWYKEAHAPIPMNGVNDSVSCYIWENEELKKTNLSLLDIGWSIIQAVERHEQFQGYSQLGLLITAMLCLTPIGFRVYFNWAYLSSALQAGLSTLTATNSSTALSTTTGHSSILAPLTLTVTSLLGSSWPIAFMVLAGVALRLLLYVLTFLMLCVAENSFEQRLQYAKNFCRLTSSRRARKYYLPHFRLNKLANIKCWLSLRSYLKKRGPQRSVESIISCAFYMLLTMLSLVCVNLLQASNGTFFKKLINWDLMLCSVALGIFLMRFLVLGTKITKKYRNLSVIITEQINLFLAMQSRPHKKEELNLAHNVLRLAENLLKEVEGPFRVCGWSMNPLLYNVLKVVILSVLSTVLSEALGFKMKLYKIKLNPANW